MGLQGICWPLSLESTVFCISVHSQGLSEFRQSLEEGQVLLC